MPANPVKNNGTINVWIHAHTHNDPGWLVNTDQYYVKVGIVEIPIYVLASALHPGDCNRCSCRKPEQKVHVCIRFESVIQ